MESSNQIISFQNLSLVVKRDDLLHPIISGNKYRKLKYNLAEAKRLKKKLLITFGGAYSNHIAAVAGAGKEFGFETLGIIRGEELKDKVSENPTLRYAQESGMKFEFLSREVYRNKDILSFKNDLEGRYNSFYLIPEGGTNALAIKGCEEILSKDDKRFQYVCVPIGTGGTIAGIINSAGPNQKVLGFSSLKGNFMSDQIKDLCKPTDNWELIDSYHFGGYGKINDQLIAFINEFNRQTQIPLDPIYTGKMLYGIVDLHTKKYFEKNSTILVIHTGGLQGIKGMNLKLKAKKRTLIEL